MTWQNGSTRAWRRTRAAVLLRDKAAGWACRAHQEGWCDGKPGRHACTGRPTHAHHTRGRAVTGDDPRHIVAACAPCNLHIGEPAPPADPACTPITDWTAP